MIFYVSLNSRVKKRAEIHLARFIKTRYVCKYIQQLDGTKERRFFFAVETWDPFFHYISLLLLLLLFKTDALFNLVSLLFSFFFIFTPHKGINFYCVSRLSRNVSVAQCEYESSWTIHVTHDFLCHQLLLARLPLSPLFSNILSNKYF